MDTEGLLYLLIFVAVGVILWIYFKKRIEQDKATKVVWHSFAGMKGLQEGKPEDPSDLLFYGKNQGFPFTLKRVMIEGNQGAGSDCLDKTLLLDVETLTTPTRR
jgi:hypothetical protein